MPDLAARSRRLGAALLLLWFGMLVGCHDDGGGTSARHAPPDFRSTPPVIERLEVQRLPGDGQHVRLFVTFAKSAWLGDRLPVRLDGQDLVLVRQASPPDQYVADMQLDVQTLVDWQHKLDALATKSGSPLVHPVFEGRALVREEPLGVLAVEKLLGGARVDVPLNWTTPVAVDADRSLMIIDPSVIGDCTRTYDPCANVGTPGGKWTFAYLMRQLAGNTDVSAFTKNWLQQWVGAQTVNGFTVAARAGMPDVLSAWPTLASGALDVDKAPFRLLAIVNRIDLAQNLAYGAGSGGEARFVFQLMTEPPTDTNPAHPPVCRPLAFTVIFEYRIDRSDCVELRDWAQQWVALASQPFPSDSYNTALEAITEQFVKPATMLAQVRTNEIALVGKAVNSWEMREFVLDANGALTEQTVRRTPDIGFNKSKVLADWVNGAGGTATSPADVPLQLSQGTPFRAGSAIMPDDAFFWQGSTTDPITPPETRRIFSLNTCNGCHAGETGTGFTHLSLTVTSGMVGTTTTTVPGCTSTAFGTVSRSGFLTGEDFAGPGTSTTIDTTATSTTTSTTIHYADLEQRSIALSGFAGATCVIDFPFNPIDMVH
jgi:hypothetical protein